MKITREPLGENLERFEMTLERSDWYGEYDKQLRQARREMAVPGFRRGQAPLGLVARRLGGEEWMYQFVNQAQQRELNRYVDAEGISIARHFVFADREISVDYNDDVTGTWQFDVIVAPKYVLPKKPLWVPVEVEASDSQWAACEEKILEANKSMQEVDEAGEGVYLYTEVRGALEASAPEGKEAEGGNDLFFSYDAMSDEAKALFRGKKKGDAVELPADFRPYSEESSKERADAFEAFVQRKGLQGVSLRVTLKELRREVPAQMTWDFYSRYFSIDVQADAKGEPREERTDDEKEIRARFRRRYVDMVGENGRIRNAMTTFEAALEAWDWSVPESHLKKILEQERLGGAPTEYMFEQIKRDTLLHQLLRGVGEETLQDEVHRQMGERIYELQCMDALGKYGLTRAYGIYPGSLKAAEYLMHSMFPKLVEGDDFKDTLQTTFAQATAGQSLLDQMGVAPRKVGIDKLTVLGEVLEEVEARGRKQEEKYARWRAAMEQSKAAQRSGEGEGEK